MGHHLGEFEQLVLMALMHLGDNAYGVTIREEIQGRTDRKVSLGAVYKTLERLEGKGLVGGRVGEPTAERGGRRKKFYDLRPEGMASLRAAYATLQKMSDGLEPELEKR